MVQRLTAADRVGEQPDAGVGVADGEDVAGGDVQRRARRQERREQAVGLLGRGECPVLGPASKPSYDISVANGR